MPRHAVHVPERWRQKGHAQTYARRTVAVKKTHPRHHTNSPDTPKNVEPPSITGVYGQCIWDNLLQMLLPVDMNIVF